MKRTFSASSKLRETVLAVAGCIGVAGAIFAVTDLFRAIHQAESLYSVGMTGLSIEADLQDYTQESRRVFVYALTTTDPNVQLPYVNAARAADREIYRLYRAFSAIQLNEAARRQLDTLMVEWKAYVSVRNDMIGLILEDHSDVAMRMEQSTGAPGFERCAVHLKNLKRLLDSYAKDQLVAVQNTYYRCAGEVCFLILTTGFLMGAVRLLGGLRKRNQKLKESEFVERQRSEILQSINANLPLDDVFAGILKLVEERIPTAKIVITRLRCDQLFIASSSGLTQSMATAMDGQWVDNSLSCSAEAIKSGKTVFRAKVDGEDEIRGCWSIPIQGGRRRALGTLDLYFTHAVPDAPGMLPFAERSAQLAALAIEHRLANEQLAFQAQHDSLTGLSNRERLQGCLDSAIADRSAGEPGLAVLWIDLDRFKQVNDALGHHVGDALLQEVARRLEVCAGPGGTAARIGGDEFVILLAGLADQTEAMTRAEGVLSSLNKPIYVGEHNLSVGASIGVALFPQHGSDRDALLRNADTAMYAVKSQGKNSCQVYDFQMGSVSAETTELDNQLRSALEKQQFELHYQPQVSPDGGIVAVEALLRWSTPTLGAVSPARFIPVAEENGMIVPLGAWVLDEACRQGSLWHRQGFDSMRIAVNVSAHQFNRSDFVATVARALETSKLRPEFLELELTETAAMLRPEHSIPQFRKLRALGVRISIDDFGTGNSSLHCLLQLPVDALKIDRSFVDAIGRPGCDSLMLVRAIIGMAHGCQLQVVAEGIETERQLAVLRSEGCDLSQGFLLHRPMSSATLTSLLCRQHAGLEVHRGPNTSDLVAARSIGFPTLPQHCPQDSEAAMAV